MIERVPYRATEAAAPYERLGSLPVAVVLENVRSLYNVGSFFRTVDAAGGEGIYLTGITARPPHRGIAKTALGSEEMVAWEHAASALPVLETLRGRGYEIAAIETSTHALDLFDWQPRFPVCLLFGHEVEGLSAGVLGCCDTHIRLPMRGRKHSLNVATAGGVALFELLRKYRRMIENREIR